MKKLYVIVVTYNGDKWIERCLLSIRNSTIDCVTIIVDNGSTDNTIQIIENHFKECVLIKTGSNLGFGKANNIGIKYAMENDADFVYLLNQDAWVDSNVFETLMKKMCKQREFGIVSPMQLTGDGTRLDPSFEKLSFGTMNQNEFVKAKKIDEGFCCTRFVMAAHWLVRVAALKKVGLFSSAFPHYGEDGNLVFRMKYHGYYVGIDPSLKAYHDRYYREDSPQKKVYLDYITFLGKLHNIFEGNFKLRVEWNIRTIFRIFREKDVPLFMKLKYLIQCEKAIYPAMKYRKMYREATYVDQ